MDERETDAQRVTDAIEQIGVGRLTDAIVSAWEQAGLDTGTPQWPDDEPRYRVRPPAANETAGLDALAVVLDATPRPPKTVFCYLDIGRRAELVGPERVALEALSGQADITVDDDHTAGTVSLTGGRFEDLAALFGELQYAVVSDGEGVPIAEWRDGRLRFTLSVDAIETVQRELDGAIADRIERDDQ